MRRSISALLLVLVGVAAGDAQQSTPSSSPPAQQPAVTFRTEINFVEVHAIVTDAAGAFVRGLTADDFEIYEDGRLQKPAAFSLIDLPVEPIRDPVRLKTDTTYEELVEPDVRSTTRTFDGRIYIFLLDDLHTDVRRSLPVQQAARTFIAQYLGPNDLAAVVHTSGRQDAGQELTSNRRLLMAAVERFQGRKLPSAGAEKLAVHLRQNATEQALADDPQPIRTAEGLQKAREVRDPYDAERALNARRALDAVQNVSTWMADVQGRRKALLFFSEGLDYDVYQPFDRGSASAVVEETREAMSAAQRANVNVYAIDPRGLNQFSGLIEIGARSDYPQLEYGTFRGFLNELLLSQESLISLADETGGLAVVNAGDVAGGLGRVVLDNSRYYLLGYYSDSARWSRKFMSIDVRVKRPGLQVRARRGFLPPDSRALARAREADVKSGTSPALRAALSKPVPVGDLPVRVFASSLRGSDPLATVLIAVEIFGNTLAFVQRNGRFNETIEVSIVAADERGRVQGSDRQNFEMNLLPQTYERIRQSGVRLLSRLNVPPGRYQIRVGVHEAGGGKLATVPYDLEVPEYSKQPFAMSGILLTSTGADAFATANPDQELQAILPAPPSVERSFHRNETLTSFVEVYDNSSRAAREIAMTMTVRDARDGRVAFEARDRRAVRPTEKVRGHGFTAQIPLQTLPPGMYRLRVEAASSEHAASRSVPFVVE
jgi:VWFA-related protein